MLFVGIFITMQPALMLLTAKGGELGLTHPAEMFWATGALSSFLDNTPTYLVFLTAACAQGHRPGWPPPWGCAHQDAGGHLLRRGVHGGQHLYRQRAQLYGQVHLG